MIGRRKARAAGAVLMQPIDLLILLPSFLTFLLFSLTVSLLLSLSLSAPLNTHSISAIAVLGCFMELSTAQKRKYLRQSTPGSESRQQKQLNQQQQQQQQQQHQQQQHQQLDQSHSVSGARFPESSAPPSPGLFSPHSLSTPELLHRLGPWSTLNGAHQQPHLHPSQQNSMGIHGHSQNHSHNHNHNHHHHHGHQGSFGTGSVPGSIYSDSEANSGKSTPHSEVFQSLMDAGSSAGGTGGSNAGLGSMAGGSGDSLRAENISILPPSLRDTSSRSPVGWLDLGRMHTIPMDDTQDASAADAASWAYGDRLSYRQATQSYFWRFQEELKTNSRFFLSPRSFQNLVRLSEYVQRVPFDVILPSAETVFAITRFLSWFAIDARLSLSHWIIIESFSLITFEKTFRVKSGVHFFNAFSEEVFAGGVLFLAIQRWIPSVSFVFFVLVVSVILYSAFHLRGRRRGEVFYSLLLMVTADLIIVLGAISEHIGLGGFSFCSIASVCLNLELRFLNHRIVSADTERRIKKLSSLRQELEQQITWLRTNNNDLTSRFNSSMNFLASNALEMRQSMNGLVGMVSLLLQSDLKEEQLEFALAAEKSSENILDIIRDAQLFSSLLSKDQMAIEEVPVSIPDMVDEELKLYSTKMKDTLSDIEFIASYSKDLPPVIITSDSILRGLFRTFLELAVASGGHETNAAGEVICSVDADSITRETTQIRMVISDTRLDYTENLTSQMFKNWASPVSRHHHDLPGSPVISGSPASRRRAYGASSGSSGIGVVGGTGAVYPVPARERDMKATDFKDPGLQRKFFICKKMVDLLNGNVSFDVREGLCTTVTFTAYFKLGRVSVRESPSLTFIKQTIAKHERLLAKYNQSIVQRGAGGSSGSAGSGSGAVAGAGAGALGSAGITGASTGGSLSATVPGAGGAATPAGGTAVSGFDDLRSPFSAAGGANGAGATVGGSGAFAHTSLLAGSGAGHASNHGSHNNNNNNGAHGLVSPALSALSHGYTGSAGGTPHATPQMPHMAAHHVVHGSVGTGSLSGNEGMSPGLAALGHDGAPSSLATPPPPPSVLVIDESDDLRAVICSYLVDLKIRALGASSISQGMNMYRNHYFHVVFVPSKYSHVAVDFMLGTKESGPSNVVLTFPFNAKPNVAQLPTSLYLVKPISRKDVVDIVATAFRTQRTVTDSSSAGEKSLPEPQSAKKLNVLIADDDTVTQATFRSIMKKLGHSCDVAADGFEAVKLHKTNRYDCIFMDCHMPVLDGFAATVEIRKWESQHPLVTPAFVFALTADSLNSVKEKCLECGMNMFLNKPIRLASVAELIRGICETRYDRALGSPRTRRNPRIPGTQHSLDNESILGRSFQGVPQSGSSSSGSPSPVAARHMGEHHLHADGAQYRLNKLIPPTPSTVGTLSAPPSSMMAGSVSPFKGKVLSTALPTTPPHAAKDAVVAPVFGASQGVMSPPAVRANMPDAVGAQPQQTPESAGSTTSGDGAAAPLPGTMATATSGAVYPTAGSTTAASGTTSTLHVGEPTAAVVTLAVPHVSPVVPRASSCTVDSNSSDMHKQSPSSEDLARAGPAGWSPASERRIKPVGASDSEKELGSTVTGVPLVTTTTPPPQFSVPAPAPAPAVPAPAPAAPRPASPPAAGSKAHRPRPLVLLVEDNLVNSKIACSVLTKYDCQVVLATNGKIAFEKVQKNPEPFDIIIMDISMPVMDGITATRLIRDFETRTGAKDPVPIIALTADVDAKTKDSCLRVGFTDYLTKPLDFSVLRVMVEKYKAMIADRRRRGQSAGSAAAESSMH